MPSPPPVHALPAKLSYTQLRAYQTCPLQYHYAHVLRVPIRGRYVFSFGQTMHLTLQQFFEMAQERGTMAQPGLFQESGIESQAAKNRVPTLDELLGMYERTWIDDWYESAADRQRYFENGRRILRDFYAKHEREGWPRVRATEQPFVAKFGVYSVQGKIDRIDATDGGVAIVDYKTGAPKDRLSADDKQQLLIYQFAATQVLGLTPMVLSYYYLEANDVQSFLGSSEDIAGLEATVARIGQRIASGDFTQHPGRWCRTCDFRNICEYAQR